MLSEECAFPGCESLDIDPLRTQFAAGKIGMYFSYSAAEPGVYENQFPMDSSKWNAAPIPTVGGKSRKIPFNDKSRDSSCTLRLIGHRHNNVNVCISCIRNKYFGPVERDFPGFSIGKKEKKMGIRGSATCELIFENCIVPKGNMLGKPGEGFKIAMKTLDGGRMGIASQALGIAQGAMDETIKYVKERKQFGRSIGQFQNTQFQLADLNAKIEAARLLVRTAAWKKDRKIPYSVDSARAKLFAAETAMEVTTKAVQFHGGYGYTREYPVERMMRDAKITEIYEGTSEVQRMVIAAALLK